MIISFRGKTTTDWPDQTDINKKEDEQSHPLFFVISFLFDDSFLTVLNIDATLHWTCYSLTLQVIQILIL